MRVSMGICSARQIERRALLRPFDDRAKRVDQTEEINLDFGLGRLAGNRRDRPVRSRPLGAAERFPLVQQLGRRFELLVLEQPPDQRLAWILARIFLCGIGARQQRPRLDVDQRGRHDQELTRHIQIHLLHQIDVLEVLVRDEGDRNVVDVHLMLLDEVQQQVERSFEVLQPNWVGFEDRFELGLFHV